MKTCIRLVCLSLSVLCTVVFSHATAEAQQFGDGFYQPTGGVQPFMADMNLAWPGRVWFEANLADQGLGYRGSYFTLGAKQHIFQDYLDGRWLLETQAHYDPEYEGFFTNIGIERVFTLFAAGAEITTGFWVDYDNDLQGDFAHAMTALSFNASIETRTWELIGNGYFPIGDSDYNQGDPLNGECFLNHSIVTQAGIDSALQGFDGLLNFKPTALHHVNGTVGIGGYYYDSPLVESFGGIRGRLGMQLGQGLIVSGEVNHDDRFDFTGVLQVAVLFGAGAKGTEYGLLGTDLEPTYRNDHIVRFQQDLELAIDPDTGRPYDVYHVDNLAAPGGDGTFERPFDNLKAAEMASSRDDIIFVREGGGTTRNMDQGINLRDGQMLLGDGVRHLIPLADGTNFILCNDVDGNRPTITNTSFGNAVNLANRNTVRGLIIDGSQGGMINGISGDGTTRGSTIRDGIIEDVTITGGPILNGIFLNDIGGDWTFARNDIQTAFLDGIFIDNACDPTSTFVFDSNNVSLNGRDGIHMEDFDAASLTFVNNTTDQNARDGIRLERFKNTAGTGLTLDFINPVANLNLRNGISLEDIAGSTRFINSNITNNLNHGVSLVNVTTPLATDEVFIGTSGGGTSLFEGNGVGTGAGIFNDLNAAGGVERLVITDTAVLNGGSGIISQATGVSSVLETTIFDMVSNNVGRNGISGNAADGIQLNADNGGNHTATVIQNNGSLIMDNNAGNAISINSAGTGGPSSLVQADIQNVLMTNTGVDGIATTIIEDGSAIVRANNITMTTVGVDGISVIADNDSSAAVNQFIFNNINITTVGGDGVDIDVFDQTFVDFALLNSTLTNPGAAAPLGDHGIEATATGDALAALDTRLRLNVIGSTITGFNTGNGIGVTGNGDARITTVIDGNTITNNGLSIIAGAPTVPFGDGVDLTSNDDSGIFARVRNNNINGNGEQGVDLQTTGTGELVALVTGNLIAGNDVQDDAATVPIESGNLDMFAGNSFGSTMCVGMSNNFFNLPVLFANGGGALDFVVELDGLTNGAGVPVFAPSIASFTIGTFSTVCEPAIVVEEAAFSAAGFPPTP